MKLLQCKYFEKYKAIYPPKCNCEACWNKWLSIGRAKAAKLARIRKSSKKFEKPDSKKESNIRDPYEIRKPNPWQEENEEAGLK